MPDPPIDPPPDPPIDPPIDPPPDPRIDPPPDPRESDELAAASAESAAVDPADLWPDDIERYAPADEEPSWYWPGPLDDPRDFSGAAADDGGAGPEVLGAGFTHRAEARGCREGAGTRAGVAGGFAAGAPLDLLPPDPVLAGFVDEAFDAGLHQVTDDELVGMLCAARRLASWQAGVELAAVAELDARRRAQATRAGSSQIGEHVSEELAAALALTARSADAMLGLAREFARIPAVRTGMLTGRIDRSRAEVFASELSGLGDIAAAAVAAAFRDIAGSMTTGQLRAALRAMVLEIDPDAARRRAERGRAEARVEAWQESSGNGALAGRELPAAEMIAADKRIDAIARTLRAAGVPGNLEQIRAMVFTALLTGRDPATLVPASPAAAGAGAAGPASAGAADAHAAGDAAPAGPGSAAGDADGRGPATADDRPADRNRVAAPLAGWPMSWSGTVNLTLPLATWLARSDAPGDVAGFGPLAGPDCRDLADRLATGPSVRWCLTLTGPDGRAVGHACARAGPSAVADPAAADGGTPAAGDADTARRAPITAWLAGLQIRWLERGNCGHPLETAAYRPGAPLRHLIKVRQRTCAFPGCRWPARACDDDHTVPFEAGGRTCECNLAPLCRYHHRAKQTPGWKVTQLKPGNLIWTMPHGRSYSVIPDSYPI